MAELTLQERAALGQVEGLDDPAKLRNLIMNARRKGSAVVERAAFQRLCFIQPEANPGTVEHDVWQSIHALEEMLAQSRGRTVRLSRTRQKIARDGEAKTAADLTLRIETSTGFSELIELGHPELTFEAVVMRHPLTFTDDVIAAARRRLAAAGINPDEFSSAPKGT
jgi:hypothetical protein